MKIKRWLNESFVTYVKSDYSKDSEPIYKNPDSSELTDITKREPGPWVSDHMGQHQHSIRFIVDFNTKSVYAAPAFIFHADMAEAVGIVYKPMGEYQFHGVAKRVGSKMQCIDSDTERGCSEPKIKTKKLKLDWSFADAYFTIPVIEIIQSFHGKRKRD